MCTFFYHQAMEYSNLRESTLYWTSDGFIRRDQQVLAEYEAQVAPTEPMSIPEDQPLHLATGREGKNHALFVNGTSRQWLHLG